VAFLPDGHHALSGTQDGQFILWDIEAEGGREMYRFKKSGGKTGIAVLRGGGYALTSEDDGFVQLWRLPEPSQVGGSQPGSAASPGP
jgi:hypothetical protein